jgi:hypothetical protein
VTWLEKLGIEETGIVQKIGNVVGWGLELAKAG